MLDNKILDINFLVLSPEPNIGRLKGTVRSIKNNYKEDAKIICAFESSIKKEQIEEMKEVCPCFKGGGTITSLINTGMKHSSSGWVMLIIEGAWLPRNIWRRYATWIKSEKDILFPIIMQHKNTGEPSQILASFEDCTLNGILMDRDFFLKIGKLSDNPLKISREFWSLDAIEKGAQFKAILGIKIC